MIYKISDQRTAHLTDRRNLTLLAIKGPRYVRHTAVSGAAGGTIYGADEILLHKKMKSRIIQYVDIIEVMNI